jgi:hypothetical protein
VVRADLAQGSETADRVLLVLRRLERPTRLRGAKSSFGSSEVLSVAGLSLRAQGGCSGLRARAGRGFEVRSEKTLEGEKPRRVSAR